MNTLLLFFALPIATIILAIAFQKILQCPFLVAGVFFAIYLIVAFSAFDASFLVYAVIYTILAFLTAVITKIITNFIEDNNDDENNCCKCGCNTNGNIDTFNITTNTQNNNGNNCCGCNCRRCR